MKHVTSVIASVALAAFAVLSLPAQAGESGLTPNGYFECRTVPPTGTVYFSSIFQISTGAQAVQPAYKQMLHDKYSYLGEAGCSMAYYNPAILAKLQNDQKSYVSQLEKQGIKSVVTGWSFTPDSKASYVCNGAVTVSGQGVPPKSYFYLSPVVSVTGGTVDRLEPAWRAYLQAQHPNGLVVRNSCSGAQLDPVKQKANDDSFIQQWQGQATVIRADWKFDPATAPAAEPVNPH